MLLFMIRGGFAPISMDETGYCMEVERTKSYLEEILPGMGYILDSVTFTEEAGTHYLRAFIYRQDEEDMTVNDCAMVSRRLSKWLDKEDFIAEEYILEVCSLGFKDNPSEGDELYSEEIGEETDEEIVDETDEEIGEEE